MGGKGSGRKKKHNDPWHEMIRKNMRKYYYKNRKIILYASKHGLKIPEARKRLKEKGSR